MLTRRRPNPVHIFQHIRPMARSRKITPRQLGYRINKEWGLVHTDKVKWRCRISVKPMTPQIKNWNNNNKLKTMRWWIKSSNKILKVPNLQSRPEVAQLSSMVLHPEPDSRKKKRTKCRTNQVQRLSSKAQLEPRSWKKIQEISRITTRFQVV